uniref:Uncharacterized protein LOC114327412 isoform X2 n=1 Tax=Diabrotica virgifera virgifera TaxID=50390 RepID=A0A6P7FEU2_DIAVI
MWSRSLVNFGIVTLALHLHCVQGTNDECDKLGILLYEDVGCTPIQAPGKSCPIKYECDLAVRNNTCLFRGKEISTTTRSTDIDFGRCNVGCFCTEDVPYEPDDLDTAITNIFKPDTIPVTIPGKFTCAILDCPQRLGFPFQKDCYRKYTLDKCCSDGQICPSDEQKIITVNPKAEKSADSTCQYGKKALQLGEGFETTVKGYDNVERAAKCECVIPPFLTCRQVKK